MRYFIYVILVGAIIGVTFGFFSVWGLHGFVPDLILLIVIALSLVFDNFDYLFVALVGGFWLDVVYSLPIGSFTIPFILCGLASSQLLRKWLFSEVEWYHFVGVIIAATLFLKLWLWGYSNILLIFQWHSFALSGRQILKNLILALLANVIFAYPVYVVIESFARSQLRWQKNKLRI